MFMLLHLATIVRSLGAVTPVVAGATSLIAAMADEIGLADIIDRCCKWDKTRCKVSPSKAIKALAICILSDRKALYRVEEFYEGKDVEALSGEGVTAHDSNDDALGRNRDRLFAAHANRVLSEVISSGLEEHDVMVGSSHFDTTSLSVYGEYENQDCENAIEVVLGYGKDRRPDLKQIQFSIGVTREGVLNYGEVLSGNSSDKTWNRKTLGKVKTMFAPEVLKDLIYVADSSLVTDENLKEAGGQVRFISRMPATYGLVAETIKKAWDLDLWELVGSHASRKEAAEYWVYETVHRINEIDYRLIAVCSSSLDSRKEKSIMKRVEKDRIAIAKEGKELAGRGFVCEPDARRAAELVMDRHARGFHELSLEVTEESIIKKRARRGRPRKDE
jgi:transposase